MLPTERVAAAFEHRAWDKVPIYQAGFASRVASAILGREAYVGGGIQQYREAVALWNGDDAHREYLERTRRDAFDLARLLDLDIVRPDYWRLTERPTQRLDTNTFLYGDETGTWRVMRFDPPTELYQVVDRSPAPAPTLDDVGRATEWMEAYAETYQPAPEHFAAYAEALAEFGHERAVPGTGVGVCVPREEIWLEAVVLRADLVGRYLAAQAEVAAKNAWCMAGMGLRYLMGGGDFASKNGPFYSPRAFHELMLPALQRVSAACHAAGCLHGFASDGNLWPVAEDAFRNSGVDFYYEIDRRTEMDLRRLRETFPRLTLMGGIASETLHRGTREEVIQETLSALEVAREHGSIIVGCSNQIVCQTPPENVEVMMETLQAWR